MYLLGIDVGTTGCKTVVFDMDGHTISKAYKEYKLIHPRPGWMELEPEIVISSVFHCLRRCLSDLDSSTVRALAISTQGEAFIPVGHDGCLLFNAVVTFDTRNLKEADWFSSHFDKFEIMKKTGAPIHPMFTITKLMWLKKNHPDIYEKTWQFMSFGDLVAYRLGAVPAADHSMAARTMAFDINKLEWSEDILENCGIDVNKMPETVPSGTVIGKVSPEASSMTGIPEGVSIVSGSHDQLCCALGTGVLESGCAMASLGTTESIVCVNEGKLSTDEMFEFNIPCYPYPVNGLYAYLTFLASCGSILKWFRDINGRTGDKGFFRDMDGLAEAVSRPTDILVLPHFSGSGTPYLDAGSKGIITGLTASTCTETIYLAILEGTCMEASLNIRNMESCGIKVDMLRCAGGGAGSDIWLQVKSDITGKPIQAMEAFETGCLGAAMLAGLGINVFSNPESAVSGCTRVLKEFRPNPEMHGEYDKKFKYYERLYGTFGNLYDRDFGGMQ